MLKISNAICYLRIDFGKSKNIVLMFCSTFNRLFCVRIYVLLFIFFS